MRTTELTVLYLVVGVVLAGAWGSVDVRRRWMDAALLLPLWPLYAPMLWLSKPGDSSGLIMPPGIEGRIAHGQARLRRLDTILASPDFRVKEVEARCEALRDQSRPRALAAAQARLQSIRKLTAVRDRLADELSAVAEMRAQLAVQGELLKLVDDSDDSLQALSTDLAARVDAIDAIVAEAPT